MTYMTPAVTLSTLEIVTRLHHCIAPFPGTMSFVLFKDYIKFNAGDLLQEGFSVRSSSELVGMSQLSFSSPERDCRDTDQKLLLLLNQC